MFSVHDPESELAIVTAYSLTPQVDEPVKFPEVITGADVIVPEREIFSASADVDVHVIFPEGVPDALLVILVYIVVVEIVSSVGDKLMLLEKLLLS